MPVTPKQIAEAAIEAAKAGAAIAHIHVRDPETGKGSRDPKLFAEVVDRIRSSDTDIVINLTAGMGGDWVPSEADPSMPGPGTDMIGPLERLAHVEELLPEICSLDCGTLNFGNGEEIYISTPPTLRKMAALAKEWGVKPELEVFELGHIRFARQMIAEGLIDDPPMFQICLGIPWGADHTVDTLKVMKDHSIVKQAGAWYTITDHLGAEHKFQSKEFGEKLSDPDFKSFVYEQICEKVILKYDMKNMGIDDVVETDEVIGD